MAGRFDFTSPGAAFTSQITQLLAERKAEERQNLLDTIAQRADDRAERESQAQNEWRQAEAASRKQRDEIDRLGALTSGLRMGDDPSTLGYKPEDIELMQRYGKARTATTIPDAPTYGEDQQLAPAPAPQTHMSFVGTTQEQERAQRKQSLLNAASAMMHSTDKTQQQRGTMLAQMVDASNGDVPDNLIAQLMAPDVPLMKWNEQTGQISNTGQFVPSNAQILTQPDFSGRYTSMNRPDKNPMSLGAQGTTHYFMDPETHKVFTVEGGVSGGGASANQSLLGVPQDAWNDLQDTAAFLAPDQYGAVKPDAMFEWRLRANRVLGSTNKQALSPKVRRMAQDFINDPNLLRNYKGAQLTPEEDMQWRTIYNGFGGQQMAEILKRNPLKPFDTKGKGGVFNWW